jgi:hypothetical protein
VGKTDSPRAWCWTSKRSRSSGPATGLGLDVVSSLKSRFKVLLIYSNITVSVQYKNNIGEDYNYLDDLVCIVRVHERAINTAIEHLEIPPVLIERLPLPLLLLLRQVGLTDPVEEQHHPLVSTILSEDSCTPIHCITMVTVSVSYKPNLIKSLTSKSCERTK